MVKRLTTLVAVLLLAPLLASCGFFFASPFPQSLAQVTHKRSLSDYLPNIESGQVVMKVMNNGARELLFLMHLPPVDNSRLLVLDDQLGIVSQYEDDRSTSDNLLGELLLVKPDESFVAGTILLNAAGQVIGPYTALANRQDNLGFYTGVPDFRFFNNASPTSSDHTQLNLLFGAPASITGVPLSATGGSYSIQLLFHDLAADTVALYFRLEGSWRIEGVLLRASTFNVDHNSYTYFFDHPTHFSIDNVALENVHYTREGTVIRSLEQAGGRRKLMLFGFDGKLKAEFPDYDHRTVEAYAAEGDHYYFLDIEKRILYRANTWW
jgi:hypothetical protein